MPATLVFGLDRLYKKGRCAYCGRSVDDDAMRERFWVFCSEQCCNSFVEGGYTDENQN